MKAETKKTLTRMTIRSMIVQPVVILTITPYYFFVLNFTWDQWVLWLWSSLPLNIIGINMSVFGFLEVLRRLSFFKRHSDII